MSIYTDGTYLKNNPSWHSEDASWKARQVLKMLRRHKECPASTICEVGCGSGEVLVELQRRLPSHTAFSGYEISPDAFKFCESKSNGRLRFTLQDLTLAEESFDVLLVLDVLEHVEDYLGFLRRIRSKARTVLFHIPLELTVHSLLRGVLMLNRNVYGHIHHFTKDTALAALRDTGYQAIDWRYTPAVVDAKASHPRYQISNALRKVSFRLAPGPSVLTLGGYALMVLAESVPVSSPH